MSLVAVKGDTVKTGHTGCDDPTTCKDGSLKVFINGIGVHYATGTTKLHKHKPTGATDCINHTGILTANPLTKVFVYVGGGVQQNIALIDDSYIEGINPCGTITGGLQATVFVNT